MGAAHARTLPSAVCPNNTSRWPGTDLQLACNPLCHLPLLPPQGRPAQGRGGAPGDHHRWRNRVGQDDADPAGGRLGSLLLPGAGCALGCSAAATCVPSRAPAVAGPVLGTPQLAAHNAVSSLLLLSFPSFFSFNSSPAVPLRGGVRQAGQDWVHAATVRGGGLLWELGRAVQGPGTTSYCSRCAWNLLRSV